MLYRFRDFLDHREHGEETEFTGSFLKPKMQEPSNNKLKKSL